MSISRGTSAQASFAYQRVERGAGWPSVARDSRGLAAFGHHQPPDAVARNSSRWLFVAVWAEHRAWVTAIQRRGLVSGTDTALKGPEIQRLTSLERLKETIATPRPEKQHGPPPELN